MRASNQLRKNPGSPAAAAEHQYTRETFNKVVCEEKKATWRKFASELNTNTPSTVVWRTLKAIDGQAPQPLPNTSIRSGNRTSRTNQAKANAAVKHYSSVSRIRITQEDSKRAYATTRNHLRQDVGDQDQKSTFSISELQDTLRGPKGKAPGADGVHPATLRNLPTAGMRTLLELLNRSWCSGVVPAAWRTATIIPIIKKNKPPNAFKSYRPVSLLSCISKTLERMVMNRIYHWQRQHSLIPSTQAGFQAGRSTTDCIAQLTQHAMNALQERDQRTLQVAIDLSTAFDRVWRARLVADLAEGGMPSLWLR